MFRSGPIETNGSCRQYDRGGAPSVGRERGGGVSAVGIGGKRPSSVGKGGRLCEEGLAFPILSIVKTCVFLISS